MRKRSFFRFASALLAFFLCFSCLCVFSASAGGEIPVDITLSSASAVASDTISVTLAFGGMTASQRESFAPAGIQMELVYPTASLSLISTAVPTVLTDPASENHSFTSVYSALPGTVRFVAVKYLLAEEDYYGDSLGAFLTVNFRALTAIPDVLSLLSAARFSVIVGDNDAAEIPSALTVRTSASIIGGQIEGSSGLDCVTDASIQVGSIVTVLDDFFVTGLEKKTSVDDYLGSFSASGGYTYMVLNLDGEQVTSGYVGAGFTIVCMKGGAEVERAIVCLRGDVTGNGSVDVYDAIGAIRDITSGGLTDVRRYASEATLNGKFDVYDAVAVLRYVTRGSVW